MGLPEISGLIAIDYRLPQNNSSEEYFVSREKNRKFIVVYSDNDVCHERDIISEELFRRIPLSGKQLMIFRSDKNIGSITANTEISDKILATVNKVKSANNLPLCLIGESLNLERIKFLVKSGYSMMLTPAYVNPIIEKEELVS